MKKLLYILFLIPILGTAQKLGADVIKYDTITSTVRDSYTVPADEVWWIYNETTGQFEYNVKNTGWTAFSGGASQLSDLSDISDATPTDDYALMGNGTNFASRPLVEADISDLQSYVTTADVGGIVASGSVEVGEESTGTNFQVTHGLGYVPDISRIHLTLSDLTDTSYKPADFKITEVTSTTFDFATNGTIGSGNNLYAYWAIFGSDNATPMTGSEIVTSIDTELGSTDWQGGGSSLPVDDPTALVQDPVDNTKQVRIDAGAITTATTRTITMPDADVDLGGLTSSNLAASSVTNSQLANNSVTSSKISPNGILNSDLYLENGTLTAGHLWAVSTTSDRFDLIDPTTIGTDDQTAVEVPITDSGLYYTGTEVEAALQEIGADLATQSDDQTLSLSGTGNKDLTIETGNTIDLTGVDGIDPDNVVSDITGVTGGTQYTNVYGQTEAGQIADGSPPAGTLSICTDCYPYIEVALSDYTTDLTTGTSKAYWRAPFAMEVMDVRASVLTAPTGANIIVDINESGTSIMTTNKLSIDATEKTSTTAATAAGITDANIADDAEITFDIDQIGSTIAGAGLLVKIYYK